jgi:hypothetical protein
MRTRAEDEAKNGARDAGGEGARGHRGRAVRVASSLCALALLAVVSGPGCEALVGGTVPGVVACQDAPGACPPGSQCVGGVCAPCATSDCSSPPLDATVEAGDDGPGGDDDATDTQPMPDVPMSEGPFRDTNVLPDVATDEAGPPLQPLTGPCAGPGDCKSGVCGDQLVLGPEVIQQTPGHKSVCTKPCCTSADCTDPETPGLVCYDTGIGGAYCVAPAWVGRMGPPGVGSPGAACTRDSDCRSAACTMNKCEDACCNPSDCTNGTACAYTVFGPRHVFACVPTTSSSAGFPCQWASGGAGGDYCSSPTNCQGQLCTVFSSDTICGHCTLPCCKSSECPNINGSTSYCVYEQDTMNNDVIRACLTTTAPTGKTYGMACVMDSDCGSGLCNPTAKVCTDVCCLDADCAGPLTHCGPEATTLPNGTATVLACQP